MRSKWIRGLRTGAAFMVLGLILACGALSDDDDDAPPAVDTPVTPTVPGQPVAAAVPAGPAPLAVGAPLSTVAVPIPPGYTINIQAPAEYQIDVMASARGVDPKVYLYQGESLVEQDDDGGGNLNSRIVRFLPPGTYSLRITDVQARPFTAQTQIQQLQPPTPVGALVLGTPTTLSFGEVNFRNRPRTDRDAARPLTLQIPTAGQYTCTATMTDDKRPKLQLILNGSVIAEASPGFRDASVSITQQLQPGTYELRIWETIYRGETQATVTCRPG